MLIYCPCQNPNEYTNLHPIEYLHICLSCLTLRCPECISSTIVSRYCPYCQFEVTASEAIRGKMRCLRGCLQCPSCESAVKGEGDHLACTYCTYRWSPGGKERPTSAEIKELSELRSKAQFNQVRGFVNNNHNHNNHNLQGSGGDTANIIPEVNLPLRTRLSTRSIEKCADCQSKLSSSAARRSKSTTTISSSPARHYLPRLRWSKPTAQSPYYKLSVINVQRTNVIITLATETTSNTTNHNPWVIINPSLNLAPRPPHYDESTLLAPVVSGGSSNGDNLMRRTTAAYTKYVMNTVKVVKPDDSTGVMTVRDQTADETMTNNFWGELVVEGNEGVEVGEKLPLLVTVQWEGTSLPFWIVVNS